MTKVRPPLTVERAMVRVADVIGYDGMAAAISSDDKAVSESTVRNWSNPDTPERCPLECAAAFDLAFQNAGGEGSPMLEWLERAIDQGRRTSFADRFHLGRLLRTVIKEGSEAEIALLTSSLPGATEKDDARAAAEIEEAIAALQQSLAAVTKRTRHTGTSDAGSDPSGGS